MNNNEKIEYLKNEFKPFEVDVEKGIGFCCDIEVYIDILKLAGKGASDKVKEIAGYKASGDINNYIIQVHALKSSLANVGADALSAKAKTLEFAGKDGNIALIEADTESFLEQYEAFMKCVMNALDAIEDGGVQQSVGGKSISLDDWQANIDKLVYYIDELEDEFASEIITKLFAYDISDASRDGLKSIQDALMNYDMEIARETAESIRGNI